LEVEGLPAVEIVWNHTKYADLANFLPEDVAHLERLVVGKPPTQCSRTCSITMTTALAEITVHA
jgi:hypothetical protein